MLDSDATPVLKLWDLRSSTSCPVAECTGHSKGVLDVVWNAEDNAFVATTGRDNKVLLWDMVDRTVIGDLTSRRGQIQGQEARPGAQQVDALVPLANMFGYATDLRSNTQGRGQYSMEPDEYQQVPKSVADKIMAERAHKV